MKRQKGFTLIELVIVIGILSLLSAFAIAVVNPITQIQKANDAQRKSDLSQIRNSLEQFYQDNGRYPAHIEGTWLIDPDDPNNTDGLSWGEEAWAPYMNLIPKDPSSSKNYVYYSDGQSYFLYASLDREEDVDVCGDEDNICPGLLDKNIPEDSCGDICNYGVSSPNVLP